MRLGTVFLDLEKPLGTKSANASILSDKSAKRTSKSISNKSTRVENFYKALESARGKRLLICINGYPDPDNIGSSLCLKWVCSFFKIEATIIHFREISHHENLALVKKLDIELIEWSSDFDHSQFDYFAVNDSQNVELPIELPSTCKLLIFVDHHKRLGTITGEFIDIRESSGSTSAIYTEYLIEGEFGFSGDDSTEETKVATALMHGIRSDTDDFVNASSLDFRASEYLANHIDKDLLGVISRQLIPAKTMDLTQIALQRKDIRGTYLFSGVGFVRDEDRDGIGQCADYLLNREGIETVVVFGVMKGYVDGSLRTKSHTLDPDKWIKDVFGQDGKGGWYGGGRKDKGGFQIPLGIFSKCQDKELLWLLIKKTIDDLFYKKIGVDGSDDLERDGNGV